MSTHPTPARPLWGLPPTLVTVWGAVATFVVAGTWVSRVVGGDPGILDWTLAAIGVVLAVVEVRLLVMPSSTSLSQALLWTALAANAVGSRVDRDAVAVATLGATIACLVGAFLAYRAEQRRPRG